MIAGRAGRLSLLALCAGLALLFGALGVWQVERLGWKRALIARVDARLAAAPVALPPAATRDPGPFEYLKVRLAGRFDHTRETRVDALTERGPGHWLLTPLETATGTILVNRGFVEKGSTAPLARPTGPITVTGLLRPSEPGGRILRPNRPARDLFYSRDTAAIAARRGIGPVAPWFLDAAADPDPAVRPLGGMTVVRFRNTHLAYALTWFALAALALVGLVLVAKDKQGRH